MKTILAIIVSVTGFAFSGLALGVPILHSFQVQITGGNVFQGPQFSPFLGFFQYEDGALTNNTNSLPLTDFFFSSPPITLPVFTLENCSNSSPSSSCVSAQANFDGGAFESITFGLPVPLDNDIFIDRYRFEFSGDTLDYATGVVTYGPGVAVPEPATGLLIFAALGGVAAWRWKQAKAVNG